MQNHNMIKVNTSVINIKDTTIETPTKEVVQYNDGLYDGEVPIRIHSYFCPNCGVVERYIDSEDLDEINMNLDRITTSRTALMRNRL
jgi:hypothetical protein